MHICGVWNGDTDERICRAGVELQTQRGRAHGKRGGGVNGSLGLTHAHYRVTQLVGGRYTAQELSSELQWPAGVALGGRGAGLTRAGTRVYRWLVHFAVQQKRTQHCKQLCPKLEETQFCCSVRPSQVRPVRDGPGALSVQVSSFGPRQRLARWRGLSWGPSLPVSFSHRDNPPKPRDPHTAVSAPASGGPKREPSSTILWWGRRGPLPPQTGQGRASGLAVYSPPAGFR